jgi:Secretion system C-terminal sorting domain
MIRNISIFLLLIAPFGADAQTIERQVIAAAGTSVSTPLQIDYTIGEIAILPLVFNKTVVTQGFQQPNFVVIPGNNVFPYLIIYPNPTPGNTVARFVLPAPASITVSIYNAIGQLVSKEKINYPGGEMQYIIKSGTFKNGLYLIQFTMNEGPSATKQLIRLD